MRIETNYITRDLYYSTTDEDWSNALPKDNWCLLLIANSTEEKLLDEIISESITRNVGYICGIGKQHDYIHNQSDIEYVDRDIGGSSLNKPKYFIITVGDESIEEGLWFGLNLTFNCDVEINAIHIIDSDCNWKYKIEELIIRFKNGYLPNDEKQTDNNA